MIYLTFETEGDKCGEKVESLVSTIKTETAVGGKPDTGAQGDSASKAKKQQNSGRNNWKVKCIRFLIIFKI